MGSWILAAGWEPYAWKLLPILLVFSGVLAVVPLLVYLERKVCALIQERVGPNRVGLLGPDSPLEILGIRTGEKRFLGGLLQPLADAVKLILKEDFLPEHCDKFVYSLAPFFALLPPLLAFVVMPVGADLAVGAGTLALQVADLHVGILWVLSVASLSAYGVALGGWASNNKYALLGGIRATAQMISYEVGLGLIILSMVMCYGSVSLREMVYGQADACSAWGIGGWGVFHQPIAFILFVVCAFAENNRLPFDMPECEAELVGGYHTEYSSMKFGMFFQGEYIAMLAMGALMATLFLGGWHFPGYGAWMEPVKKSEKLVLAEGLEKPAPNPLERVRVAATPAEARAEALQLNAGTAACIALVSIAVFAAKVLLFVLFQIWVRWTLPRFRYDQLMRLGWRVVIPVALGNLVLTALVNLP